MQFIEKNSFNVRSAVYRLKRDDSHLEFLVFPMVHVGSSEFYEEVSKRLAACDLILAEGVNSKTASLITISYGIVKYIRQMDLVLQGEGMKVERFRKKTLNTDMDGSVFDQRFSSLPLKVKAKVIAGVPICILYLLIFGSRKTLSEYIALEDQPSDDEIFSSDEDLEKWEGLLVDERDRLLIEQISKLEKEENCTPQLVGIVYGAGHMRNTMTFLMQTLKYRIVKSEWVKVFDL
jgi:hypothetical protein